MRPTVLIGSSIPPGLDQVQLHQRLKLGDLVLTALPTDRQEALAVAGFCRQHGIRLLFSEFVYRGSGAPSPACARSPEEFFSGRDRDPGRRRGCLPGSHDAR